MVGVPCTVGIGGSFLHCITASSSTASEGFWRPKERLEERREEGEEDLKEKLVELLLFRAEVMICNAAEMGLLFLLLPSPSLAGESNVPESAALTL